MEALKIRKVGNSDGVILPKRMLERANLSLGDEVHAIETGDGILLTPYDPAFEVKMDAFESLRKRYRNALRELAK